MLELTIIGHVGSVRLNQTQSSQVLTISIANNRRIGEQSLTEWVSVKVWGERAAKLVDHIKPGQRLLARGRPQVAIYAREDGSAGHELVCTAGTVEFLGGRNKEEAEPPKAAARKPRRGKREAETV